MGHVEQVCVQHDFRLLEPVNRMRKCVCACVRVCVCSGGGGGGVCVCVCVCGGGGGDFDTLFSKIAS